MKKAVILYALVSLMLLSYALHQALVVAPTEQTMGDVQRIFYYHVPSAWTSMILFFINFCASIFFLIKRDVASDAIAVATAEVGVVFCSIVLVTGPIWARPVWGIWWTWDLRLTFTLVLWLIYVSYLILRRYSTGSQQALAPAVLAVFGFLDVPFVYMTIRWFRTQHPQPVIGGGPGSGLADEMKYALLMNWLAFMVFAGLIVYLRYRLERVTREVDAEHARRALHDDAAATGGAR